MVLKWLSIKVNVRPSIAGFVGCWVYGCAGARST
jgi:hypothetical protein